MADLAMVSLVTPPIVSSMLPEVSRIMSIFGAWHGWACAADAPVSMAAAAKTVTNPPV
jgi:hypothetical protein